MKTLKPLIIVLLFTACGLEYPTEKINGISFVGGPKPINKTHITPVEKVNANWVAIMPFAFMQKKDTSALVFNVDRQWWGERKEGVSKTIELFNNKGFKIMLKPQIWIWRGVFTGTISMPSDKEWITFEKNYENYILEFAKLAEEHKVALFCIGTELEIFVKERPEFWNSLINKIKKVYSGKLTYAENWDCFNQVPFLHKLDYIGIDAYFPLSSSKTPTKQELITAWQPYKKLIKAVSDSLKKPILFTEYGYRSVDYTAKKPWDFSRENNQVNATAQVNALSALYDVFWSETWFAGGFLWKWFDGYRTINPTKDSRFTPQNKPAEDLIKQVYRRY